MTFVFLLKTFLRLVDHQIYYLNTGILEITFLKSDELYLMTTIDHQLQPCEVVSLQNCKFDSKIGRENDNNRHFSDFQLCFILKLE